jgi:NAD(P)H-dependent flavin oxidoreductase YrpB (nitropropane dioxygenase family)
MPPANTILVFGSPLAYAAMVKQIEFTIIAKEVTLYEICLCNAIAQKDENDIVRICNVGSVVGELHRYKDSPLTQSAYSVHATRCKPMPIEKDTIESCNRTRLIRNIMGDFSILLEHIEARTVDKYRSKKIIATNETQIANRIEMETFSAPDI